MMTNFMTSGVLSKGKSPRETRAGKAYNSGGHENLRLTHPGPKDVAQLSKSRVPNLLQLRTQAKARQLERDLHPT
jgi:hypothetical protein